MARKKTTTIEYSYETDTKALKVNVSITKDDKNKPYGSVTVRRKGANATLSDSWLTIPMSEIDELIEELMWARDRIKESRA